MLAELPRAIYSPVTAGTYGMISCHSLILLALRPFQHFTHTDRGKRMILIHHSVCLERLIPQPALAEGVIEVGLLCQLYQIELGSDGFRTASQPCKHRSRRLRAHDISSRTITTQFALALPIHQGIVYGNRQF